MCLQIRVGAQVGPRVSGPGGNGGDSVNPQATAGGFDLLTFSIVREGQTELTRSFTDFAFAQSFFDDQVVTLSPTAAGISADRILDLSFNLSVSSDTPGEGFNSSLVVLSQVPELSAIALLASAVCLFPLRRLQR